MRPILSCRLKSGAVRRGCLFDLPNVCAANEKCKRCADFYEQLFTAEKYEQFARCPFGYAVYLTRFECEPLVFFGLRVDGVVSKTKHADPYSFMPSLPRERVLEMIDEERYKHKCGRDLERAEHMKSEMLHGMEKILGTCHAKAESLLTLLDKDEGALDVNEAMSHLRSILLGNVQLRNLFYATRLRYEEDLVGKKFPTSIHTKFFKAMKLLKRYHGRDVHIELQGQSYNKYDLTTSFEILPYLLLENAVKFSPQGANVQVTFEENDKDLNVKILNQGPITRQTVKELCQDRVRGEYSEAAGVEGSGIGLYTCDSIAKANGITLTINPGREKSGSIDGIAYAQFEVKLNFPPDLCKGNSLNAKWESPSLQDSRKHDL